jgi:Asp-tRNA(Asn)/Glu-tRNA(Gln) amidotransferase A subunit family amidase
LTSRAGVMPLAHDLDSVGPLGRTVADAATVPGIAGGRRLGRGSRRIQAARANVVDIDAAGFTFPSRGGVGLLLFCD